MRATTVTYPLSLHDALPIFIREMATSNPRWGAERLRGELLKLGIRVCTRTVQRYKRRARPAAPGNVGRPSCGITSRGRATSDRKSTRLNSSHVKISYAVFCL